MKSCQHCGGDLLRHGVTYYRADPSIIGIRYICRECRKSFTQRVSDDKPTGLLFFNATGRPHRKDWRMAA
jgi:hypothetical protein